jgi:hypothetical protein
MASLDSRIDALEARGAALRKLAVPLVIVGVLLGIMGFVAVWPDKGAGDVLHASRLLVPSELAQILRQSHFPMYNQMPSIDMWPGQQGMRIERGLVPIVLVLTWFAMGLVVKSWTFRLFLLFFVTPVVLMGLSTVTQIGAPVATVRIKDVSARPVRIMPFSMPPIVVDQVRFVYAQQAYHAGQPPQVAGQLHAMSGAWRPGDELAKTIVGVLSDYAGAHGQNAGTVATEIAGGRPYQVFRFHFARWTIRLGLLLALAGFAIDVIGMRKKRAAQKMRSLSTEFRDAPESLATVGPFSKRARPGLLS